MEPSFSTKGDCMPADLWGGREKIIHAVGAVGKVEFISNGATQYTGMFDGS